MNIHQVQPVWYQKKWLWGLAVVGVVAAGWFLVPREKESANLSILAGKEVTVYKTPTCGCCNVFVSYLQKLVASVKVENVKSLAEIHTKYAVPQELASCHASIVDGYVVEGHVPAEVIEKLLTEKPDIKGISLPGMPSGTPGMPGPKTETWEIRSLEKDGSIGKFTSI